MNAVFTILIDGIAYASWLFIVALGLTLVFGVLKILNIAHGSFYALGAYGLMSPKSALNDWWWDLYSKAYNVYPVQAPYRMVQSLLGLKLAAEKAMAANGGKKPTHEQLAAALTGLEWDSPAGRIRMALGDGHQAIQETAIGKTRFDAAKKMVVLDDIQRFPAECVNPPANMKSEEWIKAGFPGAKGCP